VRGPIELRKAQQGDKNLFVAGSIRRGRAPSSSPRRQHPRASQDGKKGKKKGDRFVPGSRGTVRKQVAELARKGSKERTIAQAGDRGSGENPYGLTREVRKRSTHRTERMALSRRQAKTGLLVS